MTADIIPIGIPTLAPHEPDAILEAAKGKGLEFVLVIGLEPNGALWFSGSGSDAERIVFLLEWAKRNIMDGVGQVSDCGGAA